MCVYTRRELGNALPVDRSQPERFMSNFVTAESLWTFSGLSFVPNTILYIVNKLCCGSIDGYPIKNNPVIPSSITWMLSVCLDFDR